MSCTQIWLWWNNAIIIHMENSMYSIKNTEMIIFTSIYLFFIIFFLLINFLVMWYISFYIEQFTTG